MSRIEKLTNKYFRKGLSKLQKKELFSLFNSNEQIDFLFQKDLQIVIRQIEFERLYKVAQEIENNLKQIPMGKVVPFHNLYRNENRQKNRLSNC